MDQTSVKEEHSDKTGLAAKQRDTTVEERLVEGRDFYFEGGLMVLTAHFLRSRGYCCKNRCRHLCSII
jgi:hypothetical protein